MPTYVADHVRTVEGKLEVDPGFTFSAPDDREAWRLANEWSATAAGVLFQATHLRLRCDGSLIKERPLGPFD